MSKLQVPPTSIEREVAVMTPNQRADVLVNLPESYKGLWGEIGFIIWCKRWWPVLVVSPFDLPPSKRSTTMQRDWLKMYNEETRHQDGSSSNKMFQLFYWYGQSEGDAFTCTAPHKFIRWDDPAAQGLFDASPLRDIQRKLDNDQPLRTIESRYMEGMKLAKDQLKLDRTLRKPMMSLLDCSGNKNVIVCPTSNIDRKRFWDDGNDSVINAKKKRRSNSNSSSSSDSHDDDDDDDEAMQMDDDMGTTTTKAVVEEEEANLLDSLPEDYTASWGEIGFTNWCNRWWPVLVVSPFDIPAVGGQMHKDWVKMIQEQSKEQKEKKGGASRSWHLLYWYGQEEEGQYHHHHHHHHLLNNKKNNNAFTYTAPDKFIGWDEGVKRGYDQPPRDIQDKLNRRESLRMSQRKHLAGLYEAKEQLKLSRENRRPSILATTTTTLQ